MIEGLEKMGFVSVNGFMVPDSNAKILLNTQKRCESRCDNIKVANLKRICILKCKIMTQQTIVVVLRQSVATATNSEARTKFTNDIKRAQVRLIQYKKQLASASTVSNKKVVTANEPNYQK